jgi:hypothetical protein
MTEADSFKATLQLLTPLILAEIVKMLAIPEDEAFVRLYSSRVYAKLEREETKLWHLSPLGLANLLREELETGRITFPEEA